jgi:PAS domain S-box-containing protein
MASDLIRVLLIEDDPDDILILKESLTETEMGAIKLGLADRLSRGLIELRIQEYDVILLDLNLPDSHGLETLNSIINIFPKIPIVVISGLADDATTIAAVRRGAQDYVVKGEINGPMLLRILRYAIERKHAEAVLRASEGRYRTLVDTSPNGITLTDLDGKLVLCNQQTALLHGYDSPEAMLGINVYELVAPDERKLAALNAQKTLKEAKVMNIEYTLLRKDGSHFPAELSAALLRDATGAPTGFIGITRDITERKQAIEAERQLTKLREEFIASVSHELRTPLFSLLGYLDLLLNGKVNDYDIQKEFLTRASKDANRLLDKVNELLDFSQLESEHLTLNLEKVDLCALILEMLHSFQEQADARRISLKFIPKDASLVAEVDPSRMRRVLEHVVENAFKFSEMGSAVLVTEESTNDNIIINVIDQGCGIPEEDLPRIFEKYYQVSHTHTENIYGLGLGLYISKQIIDAHGGSISVKSQLGAGSTFTITIPVKKRT